MSATIGRILLMPKGNYSGSTVYNSLDWVRDNGAAWVCKVDGTVGIAPPTLPTTSNANWTLLSADGSVTGSVDWLNVNYKPFDDIKSGGGLSVDGAKKLQLDTSYLTGSNISYDNTSSGLSATTVQLAIDELAGSMGGSNVSWNQIQTSTGATKIAEITINNTTTDVYAPSGGGGGAAKLDDLSDVTITGTPAEGQMLIANSSGVFENQNAPTGGHTMLPDPTSSPAPDEDDVVSAVNAALLEGGSNDDVPSLYGLGKWSNCDAITLTFLAAKGTDTIGDWEAEGTWDGPSGSRSGWLWSADLYRTLEDSSGNPVFDIELYPIQDNSKSEVVSIYAYRIDDDITHNGVHGGAIAFKLNSAIQCNDGVYVGVKLVRQRTKRGTFTQLT